MEIKEFIEKLAEALDDMDASALSPETNFRDLDEWSSIAALSIIAMADEEFGKEISGSDIRAAKTVQDLFNLVKD